MKKLTLVLVIFFSLPALAIDPLGSHYTDFDSDGSSGFPTLLLLGGLFIVSLCAIWMGNNDKNGKGMKYLGYIGLIACILLSIKACG